MKNIFFDRELSWLSFNYRVLQEAKDPSVPLYEKIKFLAIFSSNLDEFFRVRVAALRNLLNLKDKSREALGFNPQELLTKIQQTVFSQQEEFGKVFRETIIPELKKNQVFLIGENELSADQLEYIEDFFDENIRHLIQPVSLDNKLTIPFLKNQGLYLSIKLREKKSGVNDYQYALVEVPTGQTGRFVELPEKNGSYFIMFVDDILKYHLNKIFTKHDVIEAYSIKLTRDAELYIDDEFTGNLLRKIKKGTKKRNTGVPSRFLYDSKTPPDFLAVIKSALQLTDEDLVPGGRYHNFNDFFSFPNPVGKKLEYDELSEIGKDVLDSENIFSSIAEKDIALYFPYYSYIPVIDFFETAAVDPAVTEICVTQYRVAKDSRIVKALIKAARNKKQVVVFVEIKARFDEELNIQWADEMQKAGVNVYYSFPGLKVHAKLALIKRNENGSVKKYAYLATGNFNEKTAKIYTDLGYFTSNISITNEMELVFKFLSGSEIENNFKQLLVAQFNMRNRFIELIDHEIENAKAGREAAITAKMNSLEDRKMIKKLYKASRAGVKINLIIRGICCLVPGVKGLSENINVISIVDRFLEHTRIYIFHNSGNEIIYAASADWMKRNLNRRVEVAFPINSDKAKGMIKKIIEIQLADNTKARIINSEQTNCYKVSAGEEILNSQTEVYKILTGG